MPESDKDPTEPIRMKASGYPEVVKGTACTQTSFKTAKGAFLFIGMQGGRYKAMFKLKDSRAQAEKLAAKEPDRYEAGSTAWVTTRFTADKPIPKSIWEKWLDESYALSVGGKATARKKSPAKKKSSSKKSPSKKSPSKKSPAKKKAPSKKSPAKKKSSSKKSPAKKRQG